MKAVYPRTDYTSETPIFYKEANDIIQKLGKLSKAQLAKEMKLSGKLASETYQLFKQWDDDPLTEQAHPAVFLYQGGVYQGLDALSFDQADLTWSSDRLLILSAVYGVLNPLDAIQPYRLEMQSAIKPARNTSLYKFWEEKITADIQKKIEITKSNFLANLASKEYSKVVDTQQINVPIIDFEFYDIKDGELKFISFNAKKARGLMANYMIKNRVKEPNQLTKFNVEGYTLIKNKSTNTQLVFGRQT